MHQLLQTQVGGGSNTANKFQIQSSIQLSDIISQSSFEIVKNLTIPLSVYLLLIIIEIGYMIIVPAQNILLEKGILTESLLAYMQAIGVYVCAIALSALMFAQTLFILLRGRLLKIESTIGDDHRNSQNENGTNINNSNTIIMIIIKLSGYFLIVLSTALSQFVMKIIVGQFSCTDEYETSYGCQATFRSITTYISIIGFLLLLFLLIYSNFFLTKQFPDKNIPWAAWNDRSQFLRSLWKIVMIVVGEFITDSYNDFLNFICAVITAYIVYERFLKPSVYNRTVHITLVILEAQLFIIQTASFYTGLSQVTLTTSGLVYCSLGALLLSFLQICTIYKREYEVVSMSNDPKNFRSLFQIELYVVVMIHELQKLVSNEDYGQEKHIHAIVSRHMEDCTNEQCPCKNYEPEYDKKFTTVGSKRLTKTFSSTMGGPVGTQSLQELKRLPYKVTYKTKVEIFKQEFAVKVDMFLENHPKSYGIKLLKSFFHHQYCDSSFKALFVQLENAATCKNFKGKVFIYHLKTQIQEEMKKSLESPLTIDINSLLKFEKFKIQFESQLEELGYNCQTFWTDLTKEEYDVLSTLSKASTVALIIIKIKSLFHKLISINPSCIDMTSMYALAYRYILRDESTFTELVTRIQQIKNSSKLEQQREIGVKFFDADVYAVLLVSGDQKELGRVRQATSSCKQVFGYDPRDLIGSRINKLMPGPFADIHDKFLYNFLNKGKSTHLERNQPLPVITKDGFLQMNLFYIKPMVSLHIGLIITCFAKILNKYTLADESQDFVKLNKLCIILTDKEGQICGMTESCSKMIGMPPPIAKKQLSVNDNQPFNISQICSKAMIQEYEFELVKGCQLQVDTTCLNKERQYRREYPEFASKIGRYQAEVGVHKFCYRELKTEINIFVMKVADKDPLAAHRGNHHNNSTESISQEEELTYSVFSITTANSSVSSSGVATSKFKTFKQKIQLQNMPSQIKHFYRLAYVIFIMLLSIAGGNFATNIIQNKSFNTHLDVLTQLQILMQTVPEAAHSTRQLTLLAKNMVKTEKDTIIENQAQSKYQFYTNNLATASKRFEQIQKDMKTILQSKLSFETYFMKIQDVQTDSDIKISTYSAQTSLNLLSSKILKLSTLKQTQLSNIIIPYLSFEWTDDLKAQYKLKNNINELQQDFYFIIQNGLGSIVMGLKQIQQETIEIIEDSSKQAALVAVILAGISICLIIILLPFSWPTLTHIENISNLILMALNRLPEAFCANETKACLELIMFLNESKEGEKSTHQMIKQHQHRKKNKEILKLPKKIKVSGSQDSSNEMSDSEAGSSLIKSKRGTNNDSKSTDSRGTESVTSSKYTALSKIKQQNSYQTQQESQFLKVKRDVGGTIELELAQAKTSELIDDEVCEEDNENLTEQEKKQKQKEKGRKMLIEMNLRRKKIKKFCFLILASLVIAVYFAITSFYLTMVHDYERHFSKDYTTIGQRIQCYTNVISYAVDTLARGEDIQYGNVDSLVNEFVDKCLSQERDYQQLLLYKSSYNQLVNDYNQLDQQFQGSDICFSLTRKSLSQIKCQSDLNGILTKGLTETLFYILKNMQETLKSFDNRDYFHDEKDQQDIILDLLKSEVANEIVSLHEVYLLSAFDLMRNDSFSLIQSFFQQLNNYYNMLFGIFVTFLFTFQAVVVLYLVKRLSREIVQMYHVVLLIPFSGRTQNDLNMLMMIKL